MEDAFLFYQKLHFYNFFFSFLLIKENMCVCEKHLNTNQKLHFLIISYIILFFIFYTRAASFHVPAPPAPLLGAAAMRGAGEFDREAEKIPFLARMRSSVSRGL